MRHKFGRRLGAIGLAIAGVLAITAQAASASVPVDLRVVTNDQGNLADVRQYVPETSKADTYAGPDCFSGSRATSSGKTYDLTRPTFLGAVLEAAKSVPGLNPVRLSDASFSQFGALGICQINAKSEPQFAFFNLRANHNSIPVGANLFNVRGGEDLIAYRTPSDGTIGAELDLGAPVRTAPGKVVVNVRAYNASFGDPNVGAVEFRAGIVVTGGDAPAVTDKNGDAVVTLSTPGVHQLTATGAYNDVPSAVTPICVDPNPTANCAEVLGRPVFGSDEDDTVRGTDGDDQITPRGGNDQVIAQDGDDFILARDGEKDRINCGGGKDTVQRDRKDRIAKNCERANGKKHKKKGGKGGRGKGGKRK